MKICNSNEWLKIFSKKCYSKTAFADCRTTDKKFKIFKINFEILIDLLLLKSMRQ